MKREFLTITFIGFFILISHLGFSQTSISGVINSYSVVDSIYPSKDTVEVTNPGLFSVDDTVMIYQAKGAVVETDTTPGFEHLFGNVRSKNDFNNAGKYEIILVQKVEGDKVIFKATPNNDYDTDDLVQLVSVPSYKKASIDGELTCDTWDGAKGGVLVLMVGDTLYLNDKIDVTGKGFRGASPFESNGDCASVDPEIYDFYYFDENTPSISSGFKGEGIAEYDPAYGKGLGRWANAGGGGNGRFSGGGGGANYNQGGDGGQEDTLTCNTPGYSGTYWVGVGGLDGFGLGNVGGATINDSTLFFGGGGGSGTYTSGYTASTGGNGGGVVIIIAKALKSDGDSIIAKGASVLDIATASAAGGGGGGAVVFDVESVTGDCGIYTTGGNGGRVQFDGRSGPGGGGGGGVILWNTTPPANVDFDFLGGNAGYVEELYPADVRNEASPGVAGSQIINVDPPLTGFLFNWISEGHNVCMEGIPKLISGTEPRGGNGVYSFQWKDSPDGSTWSDIVGATSKDYQPSALSDTMYYQRIVTSGSVEDKGNIIRIDVLDSIKVNEIYGYDLIKCIGNEADSLTGTTVTFGGISGEYQYIWESSFDLNSWNSLTPKNDTVCYLGTVTDTTYIRRVVASGACYDTTNNVKITGLPEISNNTLPVNQEICEGQVPDEIIGATPTNGDGSYTYSWESKTESSSWAVITDSTRKDLAPANLFETTYYRRVVQSDDCLDISDSLKVNVLIPIDNDYIVNAPLVFTCYNTPPDIINGSVPINGDGAYTYQWQESSDGIAWADVASDGTNEDYQPQALTDTIYYRRLVESGQNGCCTSISDTVEINIHLLPVAAITDDTDTVCSGGDVILEFSVTSGQQPYTLTYSDGTSTFDINNINTNNLFTEDVNPTTDLESKQFDYTVVSVIDNNSCEAVDMTGQDTVTVFGNPIANAGTDNEACNLGYRLVGAKNLGDGTWAQIPNGGNSVFEPVDETTWDVQVSPAGIYEYIWEVMNWECKDSDTVKVLLYENVFNENVSPSDKEGEVDTFLYFVDEVAFEGTYENPDTFKNNITTSWSIFNGIADINPSSENMSVTFENLNDEGNEYIEVQWNVVKGVCVDTTIIRNIKLQELFTPTGFTPNGDGINDNLRFNGLENSDDYKLTIFNRWGTIVLSPEKFSNEIGWDGQNDDGKDLPEDTYYYVLTVTDDGVTQTHKGFIVLKRF